MSNDAIIYISKNSSQCTDVVDLLEEMDVDYDVKDVSQHKKYLKELQDKEIYGTPATFIKNEQKFILGYQKNKLIKALESSH